MRGREAWPCCPPVSRAFERLRYPHSARHTSFEPMPHAPDIVETRDAIGCIQLAPAELLTDGASANNLLSAVLTGGGIAASCIVYAAIAKYRLARRRETQSKS